MPLINEGISAPDFVLGLRKAGLNYFHQNNGHLKIGATSTLTQMTNQKELSLLAEAAEAVGGWAIRNMGTVGGNLFAPPPSGDFAAALLALDADVKLVSSRGERIVRLIDFYTGFMSNDLASDELLAEVRIMNPQGRTAFTKYGRRHANTPAIVTVAAVVDFDGDTVRSSRLALNGVGPHPLRAKDVEDFLEGKLLNEATITEAGELASEECDPFTDSIASEWYRRKMIPVIVRRTLEKIAH
jgi:CO/xanthine dehydrogenase FAD-binding subunit